MSDVKRRTFIGWQGVIAEVPEDWSLSAVSGDEKNGYFRADSRGTLILEAKWSRAGKNVDLYSKLDAYLGDLKRKARKRKAKFEHKIKARDEGTYNFSWRADRKAQGRLWRCEDCGRVIIAQVSGSLSDDVSSVASAVLPTFQDHAEDGWRSWGVYDLLADVPPGYALEKHRLMSGYIQLIFRKGVNRLVIERWGLANVALKRITLAEWFEQTVARDLGRFRYYTEEVCFDEEVGLQVKGKRKGLISVAKSLRELMGFRRPATRLNGYVWLCEKSNKIYSVQSIHASNENIIDEVLEGLLCH